MSSSQSSLIDEFDGDEGFALRGGPPRMERIPRQKSSRRLKTQTRQSPNISAAKKGIHQRRNKRVNW